MQLHGVSGNPMCSEKFPIGNPNSHRAHRGRKNCENLTGEVTGELFTGHLRQGVKKVNVALTYNDYLHVSSTQNKATMSFIAMVF